MRSKLVEIGKEIVMENNEEFVTNVTENTDEQTVEENVESSQEETNKEEVSKTSEDVPSGKYYTDEEIDALIGKKLGRQEKKIAKETAKKMAPYLEAESILNQGLGTSNILEAAQSLKQYYEQKGIKINEYQPSYAEDEVEVLANYDADLTIESGYDDVIDELSKLVKKGVDNMTQREKITFQKLNQFKKSEDNRRELEKMGIDEENQKNFIEFSKKLNPNLSVKEMYEMYSQTKPKKELKQLGSIKNTNNTDNGVKEFYTYEEALKFTKADLDKNPELFKAIEKSMSKW